MNPTANNTKGENTHSYPAFDYPVGVGTGLVAVKDGVIRDMPGVATRQLFGGMQNGDAWPTVESNPGGRHSGNVLVIDHGGGEYTVYLHVSPYDVNTLRGKTVRQGEVFAKSGHNGWSTGAHLHFEVWKNSSRIDPKAYLANIKPGGNMNPLREEVINVYQAIDGRAPTEKEIQDYISKPWTAGDGLLYGKIMVSIANFQKWLTVSF